MGDLKSCPFCGFDEADLFLQYGRNGYFAYCSCELCGAKTKAFNLGQENPHNYNDTIAAQKAIAAWNRRCSYAE